MRSVFAIVGLAFVVGCVDEDVNPIGNTAADPPPGCAGDASCNDGNPCTDDRCEAGGCSFTARTAGTSCADDDVCNGDETCDAAGECVEGAPIDVPSDGDPCTQDACDPVRGPVYTALADCLPWEPTSERGAPSARQRHTAIWTGDRMMVWGGSVTGMPPVTASGALYDPATDSWSPTSAAGAPAARHSHCAVWTGTHVAIWGGYGEVAPEVGGGLYDPVADVWSPMTLVGAPSGRTLHSCFWTGTELIVFGGLSGGALGDGARYAPATDTWSALAPGPTARFSHRAVWTGSAGIVWGGNDLFDWHQDGASFDGTAWTLTSLDGAPERREGHVALWTGSEMLVWGGWSGGPYLQSGGLLDPSGGGGGTWTATATDGAPAARGDHAAVWTGREMIVWGGCGTDSCAETFGDGGRLALGGAGGTWASIAPHDALEARRGHTMVWTGTEVIVWGGRTSRGATATGARAVVR